MDVRLGLDWSRGLPGVVPALAAGSGTERRNEEQRERFVEAAVHRRYYDRTLPRDLMDTKTFASSYITELKSCLDQISLDQVDQVVEVLRQAMDRDATVYVVGNGGSAATASHMASDLGRARCGSGLPGIRAVSLSDNIAAFTAMANDTGYEGAFAEMLALQVRSADVVIAISGSGNSPNVIQAVEVARKRGAVTIGLIGFGGGDLGAVVDHQITVASRHYGAVEDLHLCLGHMLAMNLAGEERIANPDVRPKSSL